MNTARMAGSVLAAIALPAVLFLTALGVRDGLGGYLAQPVVALKTLLPALICVAALTALLRLSRPEITRPGLGWLALPLAIAAALVLRSLFTAPPDAWFAEATVFYVAECMGGILVLSLVPAWAALRVARQGASTAPRLSGLMAGLAAASGAATGYSLFCVQDNPMFFVIWYGLIITAVTLVSGALGARLLRW
nr:DUF1109 domain-containing protein [Sinirhodobacter sp. WL0062]